MCSNTCKTRLSINTICQGVIVGDEFIENVRRLYFDEKLTQNEVAQEIGVSRSTVQRIFKSQGWRGRLPHRTVDENEVYRLYFKGGLTQKEVAERLGVTSQTIINIFRDNGWNGLPKRRRRWNDDDIYRLYFEDGLTQKEVAEELGISSRAVARVFVENGWKARKHRKHRSHKERMLAAQRKGRQFRMRIRRLRNALFGTSCVICGVDKGKRNLPIHRKDGAEHSPETLWRLHHLESIIPEEWVALCTPCHRGLHWMMDQFSTKWKDVEFLLEWTQLDDPYSRAAPRPVDSRMSPNGPENERRATNTSVEQLSMRMLGEKCYFCEVKDEEKRLVIHRKDGTEHDKRTLWSAKRLRQLDPDEWVSLCQKCHRYVHWAMDALHLDWGFLEDAFHRNKMKR